MSQWIVSLHDSGNIRKMKDAGADEILLAVPFFSLRPAHVFALEELASLTDAIHACGLRAAVNCTRLFMEEDLPALRAFLRELKELQVDTVYFADEGVLFEAARLDMADRLVYQPDTLISNANDVRFYREQGCQAVALSREITLEEIASIASRQDGCEVLVHGRFSIMHSRRRLLSSYFSFLGRDMEVEGRQDLTLREATREAHMPIIEDDGGTHVFSEYTLQSYAQIRTLAEAGVARFRIDSIFHDDAWTLCALRDYHQILTGEVCASDVLTQRQNDENEHYSEGFYYTKTTLVK